MVDSVDVQGDGTVAVTVLLTVAGCPVKDTINRDVTAAVSKVPGVTGVDLTLGVMTQEQRAGLQETLRGGQAQREIPFARADSLTKVYAIASGKGGVGKSSITVNLAAAMAAKGLSVGVVDADIYGHSVPRMLGVDDKPTQVDNMIMPPQSYGVKVISIGMFTPGNTPVVWRGPMLHRALQQFLADVWWGDLDVLLMDLPPGTGDVAISVHMPAPESRARAHEAGCDEHVGKPVEDHLIHRIDAPDGPRRCAHRQSGSQCRPLEARCRPRQGIGPNRTERAASPASAAPRNGPSRIWKASTAAAAMVSEPAGTTPASSRKVEVASGALVPGSETRTEPTGHGIG